MYAHGSANDPIPGYCRFDREEAAAPLALHELTRVDPDLVDRAQRAFLDDSWSALSDAIESAWHHADPALVAHVQDVLETSDHPELDALFQAALAKNWTSADAEPTP